MGESVTEATILRWLKKEGDSVSAGEGIAELETDKVNVEVPADNAGIIQSFAHAEGDTVAVGDVLAVIGDAAPVTNVGAALAAPSSEAGAASSAPTAPASNGQNGVSAPAASPLAQALAEEAKLDLTQVKGTGPGRGASLKTT